MVAARLSTEPQRTRRGLRPGGIAPGPALTRKALSSTTPTCPRGCAGGCGKNQHAGQNDQAFMHRVPPCVERIQPIALTFKNRNALGRIVLVLHSHRRAENGASRNSEGTRELVGGPVLDRSGMQHENCSATDNGGEQQQQGESHHGCDS
jgi:hypothetical protein